VRWLAAAHARAEKSVQPDFDEARFEDRMSRLISRYGCNPERIGSRGHELDDFLHTDWDRMRIFRLDQRPGGLGMDERVAFYADAVDRVFDVAFPAERPAPADLLHVTCTGYVSPSGAQKLVERRGWQRQTTVTHVYHMGCYAALPAIRMARGFVNGGGGRADVLHAEMCTVHFNPTAHTPEQLVVQSLFADGFIRYAVSSVLTPNALEVLAVREEIVPRSLEAMTWGCSDWGMQMGLAREVPELIGGALEGFVASLHEAAGLDASTARGGIFCIHPGGPRIIDKVAESLGLRAEQVSHSRDVLFHHGNMSSATLPHVWARVAADSQVASGALLTSLAFGPGLCMAGAVLRKT
jgi:predicted naringenin-chalcone synthase